MNLAYEFKDASVYDLQEVNASFASGSLRVMYTGQNRNGCAISRDAVEAALPSLYNVPIVSHYIREENLIGGHDVSVAKDEDNQIRLLNLTEPCGVVPEHAKFRFETEADENGEEHEYLIIDGVILWKRQDVYKHIVEDLQGRVKHSMEISVLDSGDDDDGVYQIRRFEFTALCLLEAFEPCFEGSQLELYSMSSFKAQMEQMMAELKEAFTLVTSSSEDDDTHSHNHSKEGGMALPEKIALVEQYGLKVEDLDFEIDELTTEQLQERLDGMTASDPAPEAEPEEAEAQEAPAEELAEEPVEEPAGEETNEEDNAEPEAFTLSRDLADELRRALHEAGTIQTAWGEDDHYWFWDYDAERSEVYCHDNSDWLMYGFSYSMKGDNVVIDFASKKRVKLVIADWDNGESDPFTTVMSAVTEKYSAELTTLREFRLNTERAELNAQREEVLARFADLEGLAAFDALREDAENYAPDALEEKCYAIRGKFGTPAKFNLEQKAPKLLVDRTEQTTEPYGGLFVKYNV